MVNTNRDSRRQLAISAGAWALLVGCLFALTTSLFGLGGIEVAEIAVLGGLGAAMCILFCAGDIIALADHLTGRDHHSLK